MSLATYSPGEVTLYIAGLHQVTGFSPNSIIQIVKDENYFKTFKGATGQSERMTMPDKTHTMEVSLSQTSPSNSVLNALATLDHITGLAQFPVFAKDSSGESLFISASCWVEKAAEASYGKDIASRVWTIRCTEMVFGLAGNGDEGGAVSELGQLTSLLGQAGGNLGVF
jgi:hypothetical protein